MDWSVGIRKFFSWVNIKWIWKKKEKKHPLMKQANFNALTFSFSERLTGREGRHSRSGAAFWEVYHSCLVRSQGQVRNNCHVVPPIPQPHRCLPCPLVPTPQGAQQGNAGCTHGFLRLLVRKHGCSQNGLVLEGPSSELMSTESWSAAIQASLLLSKGRARFTLAYAAGENHELSKAKGGITALVLQSGQKTHRTAGGSVL